MVETLHHQDGCPPTEENNLKSEGIAGATQKEIQAFNLSRQQDKVLEQLKMERGGFPGMRTLTHIGLINLDIEFDSPRRYLEKVKQAWG
jgi:hypothetical protein